MATVVVHRLASSKKALVACQLVEELYLSGRKVLVFLADPDRAETWNRYLWTFAQNSFVPHSSPGAAEGAEDAVVIASGQLPIEMASRVLVVADGLPNIESLVDFEEIHDLVAPTAEDKARSEGWLRTGFDVVEVHGSGDDWRNRSPGLVAAH